MKKFRISKDVIKVVLGNPFPTEAIQNLESKEEDFDLAAYLELQKSENGFKGFISLSSEDIVYGLGENLRGINKRGYCYESFCSDDHKHTPGKTALYGAHDFFIVYGEKTFGVYIDSGSRVTYDVGFTNMSELIFEVENDSFEIYIFTGSLNEIVKSFRLSIGMSYVPPKWGFGYQQSRWSYETAEIVREIADGFEENDIPCDAIYLDIDYMERFKDFTISDERFPDFEDFVEEFSKKDIKLIPIIDAGVKIEAGYDVYEEGIEKGYFCTDESGKPFVAAVWPGRVHFPDFLNKDARKWFGEKYHLLIQKGIKGFWNDMNEPAIFYSEKGIRDAFKWIKEHEDTNLDIYSFFEMMERVSGVSNSIEDYKSFYHNTSIGKVNHYDVHNLYGYNMTRAADEGFRAYDPNQRFLIITRASHVGMAKHSGIWTGDNQSWWEHLKLNIQMMPSLNMVGFMYSGADTGGFSDNTSPDLMIRWMQFSIFTPLLRNHSAMKTRSQEPWRFEEAVTNRLRDIIRLRYSLVPYLYSEFMKAIVDSDMLFKPLAFEYDDEASKTIEDQLLVGDSIMIAPIYEQNAKGRMVYLPENMLLWRASSFETIKEDDFTEYSEGYHYIKAELSELLIFIRPNKILPLVKPENRVSKLDTKKLYIIAYASENASYKLFDDDGESFEFKKGNFKYLNINIDEDLEVDSDDADYEVEILYAVNASL